MEPLVHPGDATRLFGHAEVVRDDGLNFVGMGVQIAAEIQSFFGIREFLEDIILVLQSLFQSYPASQ
jgi:hypothetical protein